MTSKALQHRILRGVKACALPVLLLALPTARLTGQPTAAAAQPTNGHPLGWITLGTQGGPGPNGERSQPGNVLLVGSKPWLVDCGDGVMERFGAAGFTPMDATVVFISHLHVDHIGGLGGVIALHWFRGAAGSTPVTVYGPPGTDKLIAGIVESLAPSNDIAVVEQPGKWTPAQSVKVVIVKGASDMTLDGVRVRAVENSHFDNPPGHPQNNGTQSLSYRFDLGGYSIGYTGDTGPSEAVARLEQHVNLLFSEVTERGTVTDANGTARVVGQEPANGAKAGSKAAEGAPGAAQLFAYHFLYQHLTPDNAGKLAAAADVQHLVFTHLAVPGPTAAVAPGIIAQAQQFYKGPITVAHDLERF